MLCNGKERGKGETATVQILTERRIAVNFIEVSRHSDLLYHLLYNFPLWLCDVLIPALNVTTVKNYRAVKFFWFVYGEGGVW